MRADNTRHVIAAAHRRSQAAHDRAVAALRRMDDTGIAISFDAVAREASVSRSWLYNHPDLRAEIQRLRQRGRAGSGPRIPDRQRSSDASLRQRLDTALERIRELHEENRRLRDALAAALGDNRVVTARQPRRDTPTRQPISPALGPRS